MSVLGLSITNTEPAIVGAGFWIRALARLVDLVFGSALGYVAGFVGGVTLAILQVLSLTDAGWANRVAHGDLSIMMMSLVGALLYHTICEGVHGSSLGKLVCGLRVVAADLTPCRAKPAFVRSLAYFLDSLVFGVVGYLEMKKTRMQQRHGDRWARTVVLRKDQIPEGAKRTGARFLTALVLGSAGWGLPMAAAVIRVGL